MASSHSVEEAGIRETFLDLPEDEGEGLGFTLTKTLWDPYPWVRSVIAGGRAELAGIRSGDCIIRCEGADLLGIPVRDVATMIRGPGSAHSVSLIIWSCGTSPQDDPELLWSAGGGLQGEKARGALSGVLKAISCAVCSCTPARAYQCTRGHIFCTGCRARLQNCALCRESLPSTDAPHARNLIAEQVFEAIASAYDLKDGFKRPNPKKATQNQSPLPQRSNQYKISLMQANRQKTGVRFGVDNHYGSDSCLNRPHTSGVAQNVRQPVTQPLSRSNNELNEGQPQNLQSIPQHRLLTNIRPACSLHDLLSASLGNLTLSKCNSVGGGSLDNVRCGQASPCEGSPIYLLQPATPLYVLACDHTPTA